MERINRFARGNGPGETARLERVEGDQTRVASQAAEEEPNALSKLSGKPAAGIITVRLVWKLAERGRRGKK